MNKTTRKLAILAIMFSPFSAQAGAILQVNEAGILTGATNVLVDGADFDVAFVDGSCISLYEGCNEQDDFLFNTVESATLAAQALLDQVLVGEFDATPSLVNGCNSNYEHCTVLTAWTVSPAYSGYARTAAVFNYSEQQSATDLINPNNDLFNYYWTDRGSSTYVYAVWSEAAPVTAVPEPSQVALWFMGLSALGFLRRRQGARAAQR